MKIDNTLKISHNKVQKICTERPFSGDTKKLQSLPRKRTKSEKDWYIKPNTLLGWWWNLDKKICDNNMMTNLTIK